MLDKGFPFPDERGLKDTRSGPTTGLGGAMTSAKVVGIAACENRRNGLQTRLSKVF